MYKRRPVKKLTGKEQFRNTGNKQFSVLEFWQYGFSNLNSNVIRGVLAEFVIENAIKDKVDISVRNPWGDYDVITKDGKRIEVKCASYLQDWDQKDLSRIVWSGLKAKELYWSSAVNETVSKNPPDYKSDIYILALLKHQDPNTLDILDMDQWCFYILSRHQIKEVSGNSSSISLARLEKHKISPVYFSGVEKRVVAL